MELRVAKNRHFSDKNEFFDQLVVFNRGRGMGQRVPNDHLEPMVLVKYARATPDGGRLKITNTLNLQSTHFIIFHHFPLLYLARNFVTYRVQSVVDFR